MTSRRTRSILMTVVTTLAVLVVLGLAGGLAVWRMGWYDVRATSQHWQVTFDILERGMRYSVARRADTVSVPAMGGSKQIALGAAVYRDHCVQCHGAPGIAPEKIGKSMQPVPGPLVDAARRWRPAELYVITRYGIKMSGMPAWQYHLNEPELWAVVAFMQHLPSLSVPAYAEFAGNLPSSRPAVVNDSGDPSGNAQRGRVALAQYACASCHIVPGVTGPRSYVGPPLVGLGERAYIAGRVPNTAHNLAQWIRKPHGLDPHSAMPDLGLTQQDAADISAYLLRH
jgi:mono/diheme cytochrome c family protein